jgi:hypothetical protein
MATIMSDISQFSTPTPSAPVSPTPTSSLPIEVGDWVLRAAPDGIAWQLTARWKWRHIGQAVFFLVMSGIFVFLGAGAIESGLAKINPSWLPYVAFAVAAVLVFSAMENIWKLVNRQQVIVDEHTREVRCERSATGLVDWRVPFDEIECLLVSQEPAKPQGRRSSSDPMQIAQDAWVHLCAKGQFYLVSEQNDAAGKSWRWETVRKRTPSAERYLLDLAEYDTPLHHAVIKMADRLGIKAYLDIR